LIEAVILAAAARRAGAPYPVFLAIGGALLDLHDDDPVGQEVNAARERALQVAPASFAHDRCMQASHEEIRRAALGAARRAG